MYPQTFTLIFRFYSQNNLFTGLVLTMGPAVPLVWLVIIQFSNKIMTVSMMTLMFDSIEMAMTFCPIFIIKFLHH